MKDLKTCEQILLQKMALLDGEKSELGVDFIDAHLAACENCRRELAQMETIASMFARQQRQVPEADLWSAIDARIIGAENAFHVKWQPFALLGALLVVYKLVEMIPARDLGWTLKLVPFALVVAIFGFLRENPFKINTELILEK
jgi:predicted anti-sigma-YlaC factor YlaD